MAARGAILARGGALGVIDLIQYPPARRHIGPPSLGQ
jgi:hypothetical protein